MMVLSPGMRPSVFCRWTHSVCIWLSRQPAPWGPHLATDLAEWTPQALCKGLGPGILG